MHFICFYPWFLAIKRKKASCSFFSSFFENIALLNSLCRKSESKAQTMSICWKQMHRKKTPSIQHLKWSRFSPAQPTKHYFIRIFLNKKNENSTEYENLNISIRFDSISNHHVNASMTLQSNFKFHWYINESHHQNIIFSTARPIELQQNIRTNELHFN